MRGAALIRGNAHGRLPGGRRGEGGAGAGPSFAALRAGTPPRRRLRGRMRAFPAHMRRRADAVGLHVPPVRRAEAVRRHHVRALGALKRTGRLRDADECKPRSTSRRGGRTDTTGWFPGGAPSGISGSGIRRRDRGSGPGRRAAPASRTGSAGAGRARAFRDGRGAGNAGRRADPRHE